MTETQLGRRGLSANDIRYEGVEKVSGAAGYAADATRPGMLWAAFAGSPLPHARILSIDASAARAMPGVRAVLTGADIGERYFGRALFDWPVLANGIVRFAGQHVAAVAAETREQAAAAARAVEVLYEELPAIFDPETAIAPGAAILHEHPDRYPFINAGKRMSVPHPNMQGHLTERVGEPDAAFATAHRIFAHTFTTPSYFGAALEPRATLVWIDDRGRYHVISTNKAPFALRGQLAITTGLRPEDIIIEQAYVGGDFGSKGLSVDEFAGYFLAKATGRPIKAVRSYADDMRSTNVRHASRIALKTGVDADGRIVAMQGRVVFNGGAYAAGKPIVALVPARQAIPTLPYRIPNLDFELMSVYTNTVPAGHVRAPGDPQTYFAVESHIDMIARELGLDALEFRRRNLLRAGDRMPDGHELIEPRAAEVLELMASESMWGAPLPPGRGRGAAISIRHVGGGSTNVKLLVRPGGEIEIQTGLVDQGGGLMTAIQRVASIELGIAPERVRISRCGTDIAGRDPGAGGSRATHIIGNAVLHAIGQLRQELDALGWDGMAGHEFLGSYDSSTNPASHCYSFCGYIVEVDVDAATGRVTIEDVLFVADVGTVINPIAHRGQIDGGFVFGLGHAVTEELVFDDGRIVNPSFADYKLPVARDLPPFRAVLLHDAPGPGPFGAKSAGELNTGTVGPAIANAVAAACGARVRSLPITAERVYELLQER